MDNLSYREDTLWPEIYPQEISCLYQSKLHGSNGYKYERKYLFSFLITLKTAHWQTAGPT